MPAVAGQGAGADEHRAGEAVGVAGRPGEAPGSAEVVGDQVGALDAEGVERAAHEGGVRLDGLREALGP